MEVRQTEEGFQESVPALVSISYFPAQVKRPAGTSHMASPGCGQESWIWPARSHLLMCKNFADKP